MKKILSFIAIFCFLAGGDLHAQENSKAKNVSETISQKNKQSEQVQEVYKEEWPSIARHSTPEWFRDA